MKSMISGSSILSVVVNKSDEEKNLTLILRNPELKPAVLFANKNGNVSGKDVKIMPEETLVIEWR